MQLTKARSSRSPKEKSNLQHQNRAGEIDVSNTAAPPVLPLLRIASAGYRPRVRVGPAWVESLGDAMQG